MIEDINRTNQPGAVPPEPKPRAASSWGGSSSLFKRMGVALLALTALAEARSGLVRVAFWGDHYQLSKDEHGKGGFSGLKTLFDQQDPENTLLLCTGDILYPNLLSMHDEGKHRIDLLNDFHLDAAILGNHDLDGGTEVARKRMEESNFPWLAANAFDRDGKYFTGDRQTLIREIDGIQVGIFGLLTESTPQLGLLDGNVTFAPIVLTAKRMVQELKEQGAQLIFAGTHLDPDEDEMLAREVPEIDGIFGGHDHSKLAKVVGRTLIMKPGQDAQYLATAQFQLESKDHSPEYDMFSSSWNFISNQNVAENEQMAKKVENYQQHLESLTKERYEQPIAKLDRDYDSLSDNVRSKASPLGTLIASSLCDYGKADIGFLLGGNIRGDKVFKVGDVMTYGNAVEILPFGDMFAMIEISGTTLLATLETGVAKSGNNPLELKESEKKKPGRFPHFSGLAYNFDPDQPAGKRVVEGSVFINGTPLDPTKMYKVATTDHLLDGLDGYDVLKGCNVLIPHSEELLIVDVFADYMKRQASMKVSTSNEL